MTPLADLLLCSAAIPVSGMHMCALAQHHSTAQLGKEPTDLLQAVTARLVCWGRKVPSTATRRGWSSASLEPAMHGAQQRRFTYISLNRCGVADGANHDRSEHAEPSALQKNAQGRSSFCWSVLTLLFGVPHLLLIHYPSNFPLCPDPVLVCPTKAYQIDFCQQQRTKS